MAGTAVSVKNRRKETGCCSVTFLRSVLVVFNVIFWLTGLTFLGLGIWALASRHDYIGLLGNNTYSTTTFLFLSVGVLIILVGFMGCLGALRQIRCCLVSFAFLLLIIFILEAVSGVLAYLYENTIREELTRNLNKTLTENYYYNPGITKSADSMQEDFQCCGAQDYTDWQYSRWLGSEKTNNKVPDSCCISPSKGCGENSHPSNIYRKGCWQQLEQFLRSHLIVIGGVGLGFCCLQVFGIVFACCLARKIKVSKEFI
ncbi:CD151 antigen-like isoform X2 [Pomacea canaliculata]|nr:CD151 antigen-like isoform X2 [Pomacea canaliculata]XP_025085966.1 CD151 antigen-like isoform X2 [Pomacea canaliculata]XP_025085967.1 CD151 antigen-like isoform X2 [Pomacea canaliculata]